MWYLWLIAAGVFFIIEIATTGFLIFWLGIGALLAMCASFITESILIQTAVFVISSIALIPLTKIFANKIDKGEFIPTNAFSLIGKKGVVTIDIDTVLETGQVKVNSQVWSAKADLNISKGTEIEVLKIDGVKLIVKPTSDVTMQVN